MCPHARSIVCSWPIRQMFSVRRKKYRVLWFHCSYLKIIWHNIKEQEITTNLRTTEPHSLTQIQMEIPIYQFSKDFNIQKTRLVICCHMHCRIAMYFFQHLIKKKVNFIPWNEGELGKSCLQEIAYIHCICDWDLNSCSRINRNKTAQRISARWISRLQLTCYVNTC